MCVHLSLSLSFSVCAYVCVCASDRALEIESTMVKARQRRAVARMHMARRCEGKGERECETLFAGAVTDLECAAAYEPASKTIREDLQEAMSCTLQATRAARGANGGGHPRQTQGSRSTNASRVWRRIHVTIKDDEKEHVHSEKLPDSQSVAAVEAAPQGPPSLSPSSSPSSSSSLSSRMPPVSTPDAPNASSKADSSPRTAVEMASSRVRVKTTAPQSSFEFENRWKALDGDNTKRRELLASLVADGEKSIRAVFQSSLNADMLFSVLEVLIQNSCDTNAEETLCILRGFTRVERFDMTMLLLGKKRIAALCDAWRDVSSSMAPASIAGFRELGTNFKFLV